MSEAAQHSPDPSVEQWRRNRLPVLVDIASGILFFIFAKLFGLTAAALVGAALALVLVLAERWSGKDLTGGLVLFGVAMSLLSAGLALAFQTDEAVKWRSTMVGALAAAVFLSDALVNRGQWLGRALTRYVPFAVDPRRIALGMGLGGLVLAGANLAATRLLSTDHWLIYRTVFDDLLAFVLTLLAMAWARIRPAD